MNEEQHAQAAVQLANSLFPPPPEYYKQFTSANLARYADLNGGPSGTSKSKAGPSSSGDETKDPNTGREELELDEGAQRELAELKFNLTKPRVDWVVEEGKWLSFGQQYSVEPAVPTLEDIGLPQWVDPDESPQTSLPPLLHSFLHTLLLLIDVLTNTARIPGELEEKGLQHEGDQYIQHLSNLAATMMVSANQLRGVQAEATLVLLLEKQVAVRREQTQALRDKCRSIASSIKALKEASQSLDVSNKLPQDEGMDIDGQSGTKGLLRPSLSSSLST